MPWNEILNHKEQIERFRKALFNQRLASTYLFVGKPGIGKRKFALTLVEALLCEHPIGELESCGECSACKQVQSLSHPDLILISKPDDKAFIPVELFIGDQEHRRQVGLIHDIGLKPFRGGRKIAIIDDADFLNQEGANSLLKTLEEPPPHSLLILIGTSVHQQLKTILSRSQVVRFNDLTPEEIRQILDQMQAEGQLETSLPVDELAVMADGSMELAIQFADSDWFEFRKTLMEQLSSCDPGSNDFAKTISGFVEAAGTDAALKRARLILIGDVAIGFFRLCYLQIGGSGGIALQPGCADSVSSFIANLEPMGAQRSLVICGEAIERTLELQRHVLSNANAANIIDAWLIQLGRIFRSKVPVLI